jgi:hypothetical protein
MKPTAPFRCDFSVLVLAFVSVPGYPSAIHVFALTHSPVKLFNDSRGLSRSR